MKELEIGELPGGGMVTVHVLITGAQTARGGSLTL